MQSHKNQIHRLLLIDRVLQTNTFNRPDGATRESLEQSVRELLTSDEAQFLTPLSFEDLWKGKDAFRKDLKFILTHYPGIMQKRGNKLWSYQSRGISIFPRFGGNIPHQAVQEGILLLEYCRDHPMSQEFDAQHIINTLKKWYGMTAHSHSGTIPLSTFKHQFSLEDAETLTSANAITLYDCCEANRRRIVNVCYTSARTGESRELEFHPWQFIQSEGRWYVSGYISHDLLGNYPTTKRSNYPALVLKLDEINAVSIIDNNELSRRKRTKSYRDIRHTYQSQTAYPSLLNLQNRIGIGGWDKRLSDDYQSRQTTIRFRLKASALPYFKTSELFGYIQFDAKSQKPDWIGLKIHINPRAKHQRKRALSLINRETIHILTSYGPAIEILEPRPLRRIVALHARQTHALYDLND